MGVTYKLKREVVDFIIESKQQDPSLSCRSLVSLVSEKFRVHVSKSSVSDILKDAALSSPIGRRVQESKTQKFVIPSTTKQKLFENIAEPSVLEKKSTVKESSRKDDSIDQNLVDKLLAPPKISSTKPKPQEKKEVTKSKGLPLMPDPVDNFPQQELTVAAPQSNSVENVDDYYKQLLDKGIKPSSEPKDWEWGNREFVVKDPDGYRLVFFNKVKK